MKKRGLAIILGLLLLLSAAQIVQANSAVRSAMRIGGIGAIVSTFGSEINNFINRLTFQQGSGNDFATKVVPIISVGSRRAIGAVQVTGSQELVNRTQAVVQTEGRLLGSVRVRALIPSDSSNPLRFNRVQGVGVSALIDVDL